MRLLRQSCRQSWRLESGSGRARWACCWMSRMRGRPLICRPPGATSWTASLTSPSGRPQQFHTFLVVFLDNSLQHHGCLKFPSSKPKQPNRWSLPSCNLQNPHTSPNSTRQASTTSWLVMFSSRDPKATSWVHGLLTGSATSWVLLLRLVICQPLHVL